MPHVSLRWAAAITIGASHLIAPSTILASEYGCTVLLCLAHPDGPEAVTQCIDPIRKLRQDLARGRPFPSCEEASADGSTRAQLATSRYPPCPSGTQALPQGAFARAASISLQTATPVRGIGEGSDTGYSGDESVAMPPKICVGAQTATAYEVLDTTDNATPVAVGLYRDIVQLNANEGNAVDIYINNQRTRQVQLR